MMTPVKAYQSAAPLPKEMVLHIFSYLTEAELSQCGKVCRHWNRAAQDAWERIVLKKIHGKTEWETIGKVGNGPSFALQGQPIPWRITCKILQKKGPFGDQMAVLIPETINGVPTTLNLVIELLKTAPKPIQFQSSDPLILKKYGNESVQKSYWALMTDNIIGETLVNPIFLEPKVKHIARVGKGKYRLPRLIEMLVFTALGYQVGKPTGYAQNPYLSAQCIETVETIEGKCSVFFSPFDPSKGLPNRVFYSKKGWDGWGAGAVQEL